MASEPASEPADESVEQAVTDPANGPFTSQAAIVNFWINTPTGGAATQAFLNGHLIYSRAGFGPALISEYFTCQAGGLYEVCPTGALDGFATFQTLLQRIPAGDSVVKDGVPFRTIPNTEVFSVTTCTGDQSVLGIPVKYVKVTGVNGFVPYSSTCYP